MVILYRKVIAINIFEIVSEQMVTVGGNSWEMYSVEYSQRVNQVGGCMGAHTPAQHGEVCDTPACEHALAKSSTHCDKHKHALYDRSLQTMYS